MVVPRDDVRLIRTSDAYVTDMQLGSYEASLPTGKFRLRCDLDPRYQLYCPTTRTLGQLCYSWIRRRDAQMSA